MKFRLAKFFFLAIIFSVVMVLMVRHVIDSVDVVPFPSMKVTATMVQKKHVIVDFLVKMQKRTKYLATICLS